jgi:hypothetical protein
MPMIRQRSGITRVAIAAPASAAPIMVWVPAQDPDNMTVTCAGTQLCTCYALITHGPHDITAASRDDNSALSPISRSPRKASTAQSA